MSVLFFALFLGLFFTSCKKDEKNEPSPNPTSSHYFSCEVAGTEFNINGLYAYAVNFDDTYNIYGVEEEGTSMYVAVDQTLEVGTHAFDDLSFALITFADGRSYNTLFDGGSGEVIVEEKTATMVKGRFHFTAISYDDFSETIEVKDGRFQVEFR